MRTLEQTERLLELFLSLSEIPEIEQFISLFKDFDTALKFSRSPYLVEKYKNYLAQLQSKLDVEIFAAICKVQLSMRNRLEDTRTDTGLTYLPIPRKEEIDWSILLKNSFMTAMEGMKSSNQLSFFEAFRLQINEDFDEDEIDSDQEDEDEFLSSTVILRLQMMIIVMIITQTI